MDDVLNWLKTRAEHEAAVLALALLRALDLVLAPVVALALVQGVPGAKAEAAPRDPEARAAVAPSPVDVPRASRVRVRQESRDLSPDPAPSLVTSLLIGIDPSPETNLWIRAVTAATACQSRAPVPSR